MANSPKDASDSENAEEYQLGWKAVNKLMMEGRSWSGHEANCVFLNTGTERFANVSAVSGLNFIDDARGIAVTDWDQDGALDLWLANRSAPQTRFLHNQGPKRHFVALRLKGTTSNGDAIGARVELFIPEEQGEGPARRYLRTLHAADGFLSQSSKWIQFGLGDVNAIDRVEVRWPGGETESFTGLAVDQHYQLVQGSGEATRLEIKPRTAPLKASTIEVPKADENARVVLGYRLPFPALSYSGLDGSRERLPSGSGPLLVNIWGSDCAPCIAELGELEQRRGELEAAGLTVVALSGDQPKDHDAARAILEGLDFQFDAGFADIHVLDALDYLQSKLTYRQRSMPIPTSFLVSPEGEIAVLYKGAIEVDVLLKDLELLEASSATVRMAATPLVGRWLYRAEAGRDLALRIARELFGKDLFEAAGEVFVKVPAPIALPEPTPETAALAARELTDYRGLAMRFTYKLVELDQLDLARRVISRMLEQQPEALFAVLKLGTTLEQEPNPTAAAVVYRAVLDHRPRHLQARLGLAGSLLRTNEALEALPILEEVQQEKPQNPNARYLLALAYDALGRRVEGEEHLLKAISLRPKNLEFQSYLERRGP